MFHLPEYPIPHNGQLIACFYFASHQSDAIPESSRRTLETLALQLGEVLLRIRSEAAIRIKQQNLSALFAALDDFVIVLDTTGRIIHQNPTVARRLGYDLSELWGRSLLMIHPLEQHIEIRRILGEVLSGHREVYQTSLRTRSGKIIPVQTRISRGEWNGHPALISVSHDISELLASQHQIADERTLLRTLYETLPDPLWIKDLQGRFLSCNTAFTAYFGAPEAAIIGKTDFEFVDAETATAYSEEDRATLAAGAPRTNEKWLVYPDGRRA